MAFRNCVRSLHLIKNMIFRAYCQSIVKKNYDVLGETQICSAIIIDETGPKEVYFLKLVRLFYFSITLAGNV